MRVSSGINTIRLIMLFNLVFLIGSFTLAQERTLIFQNGLEEYEGTEDTFVMTSHPGLNTNFDNHPEDKKMEFEWDGSDKGGRNIGLIQFKDFVGDGFNQIPPNAEIVKAELQTTVANTGSRKEFSIIHNLLVEWDQDSATYYSVFGRNLDENPEIGVFLSESSIKVFHDPNSVGNTWSVEITPLVQEIVNGLPNNGFAILPSMESTNGFGHFSSETPRLEAETVLTINTTNKEYRFKEGENGYFGVKDAWIGNKNQQFFTNFGDRKSMNLHRDAADDVAMGLLRFDDIIGNESGQIPPRSSVLDAHLRMWVRRGGNDPIFVNEILPFQTEVLGVTVDTFFDEHMVTYENFVEDGVFPQFGVEIEAEPVATVIPKTFSPINIDVTKSLQKWVRGKSPNYGWLLEASSSKDISLTVKESGEGFGPPKLIVTYVSTTPVGDFMLY